MSTRTVSLPTEAVICDLCDNPINAFNGEKFKLDYQYGREPKTPKWYTLFYRQYSEPNINWDFHAQCLIDALKPLIDKKE